TLSKRSRRRFSAFPSRLSLAPRPAWFRRSHKRSHGMTYCKKQVVLALTVVVLAAGRAQAEPDPTLKPTDGSVPLKAGFLPDPFPAYVVAGGDLQPHR